MSKLRQHLTIRLRYLTKDSKRAKTVKLTEQEYFDPEYELHGRDRISSVPLYQDAWRYIQERGQLIIATTVTLIDTRFKQRRVVATSYWNNMESQLTEVRERDIDNRSSYREFISSQKLLIAGKSGWLIERWQWSSGHWVPTSCAFVEQLSDGTQLDYPIEVAVS